MLVELVGDLFPQSGLIPTDPVKRAQARFFIEGVSSKFVAAWFVVQFRNASVEDLYAALEYLQSLLPAESGFAIGEFSAADIAIAPFLARLKVALKNDIGAYKEGEGKKTWEVYHSDGFAKLRK